MNVPSQPFREEVVNGAAGVAEAASDLLTLFGNLSIHTEVRVRFSQGMNRATVGLYHTEELEYINTIEVIM